MSSLFASIAADGSILAASGVTAVTRGVPEQPKAYVLKLNRAVNPLRTHVSVSCRATTSAPAERSNQGMLDATHAAVVFFGEDHTPCDMAFTITVEEF